MAQFRANIQGNRGEASRLGTKASGINSSTNGWHVGVDVMGFHNKRLEQDTMLVKLSSGSSYGYEHEIFKAQENGKLEMHWNNIRYLIRLDLLEELYTGNHESNPEIWGDREPLPDVSGLSKLMVHNRFVLLNKMKAMPWVQNKNNDIEQTETNLFWPTHPSITPTEFERINKLLESWNLNVRMVEIPIDPRDCVIISERYGFVQSKAGGYCVWDFAAAYMLAGFLPPYHLTNGPVEALAHQFNTKDYYPFVHWVIDGWVETFIEMMGRYGNGFHKIRLIRETVNNMVPHPNKED